MIIGIGINLQNASRMERELGGQAHLKIGALDQLISATKPLPDTEYIWLKILDSCAYYLAEFERFGFSYFQASWSHWDAYQGQLVSISGSGQAPLFGEAVGVDSQGALILQRDKQSTLVHAGDVSLRVQA
jgi:BirA family biotin operon repressor/biotin-[acetyl-CoA-carboxylase] ligase